MGGIAVNMNAHKTEHVHADSVTAGENIVMESDWFFFLVGCV